MSAKGSWRSGFEDVSNYRMYYRDWRPMAGGEGLPIIALHGSLSQGGMWFATAERVGALRMICPDQRGYGKSADPGRGDAAADFALDAIRLADALLIDRFAVMGHSFAGAIALKVAEMEPGRVAGVVLVDPTVRSPKGNKSNLEVARQRPHRFKNYGEAKKFLNKSEEGQWPAKNMDRFLRDIMVFTPGKTLCEMPFENERLVRLREFQASASGDYFPDKIARKIILPVLIFRGGKSRRFSGEGQKILAGAFPKKPKVVLCPRSGHFPPVQEPSAFDPPLRKFVSGLN